MRLTKENKEKVRQRIVKGAAGVLRGHGYDDVNLDQIMQAAGLTRGAFYSHFATKAELFAAVFETEHPLLQRLEAREGSEAGDLAIQLQQVFADYLDPRHFGFVIRGCTLAALTTDAARAGIEVRKAYTAAWNRIVTEMARGQSDADPAALHSVLVLATGAIKTAAAVSDEALRDDILRSAGDSVRHLLKLALQT